MVPPRLGRLSAAGSAFAVTVVTLLGGIGVLPGATPALAAQSPTIPDAYDPASPTLFSGYSAAFHAQEAKRIAAESAQAPGTTPLTPGPGTPGVPEASGTGRRVVLDISEQRVWLVAADGAVRRSYLVSGSLTGNLRPGGYEVYSTSRWAVGVDDSGTMQYFVRFARGARAAIGFHSIPTKNGRPLQSRAQLGTPRSHGCIRQALPDARAMWAFAPVGTKVHVTA